MKWNRVLLRVASVGMAGSLLAATPAFADRGLYGVAGISTLFNASAVEEVMVSGVAQVDATSAAYLNARNVLADNNTKYEMTQAEKEERAELASSIQETAEAEQKASPYDNVAISQVNNYVNIRTAADEEAEIVGKIYNNAAATILDTVNTDNGTWYQIESGSVKGYIKSDYFVTGEEAEAIAFEVGDVKATVSTETLRLRSEASLDSSTVTLLSEDEKYDVLSQKDGFAKLKIDDDIVGYVSSDYVEITVDFSKAISLEEEAEALEAKRKAEESIAASKEEAAREEQKSETRQETQRETERTETKAETQATREETKAETTKAPQTEAPKNESVSGDRSAIVDYALSFVGNVPYVYGGNSLSTGVDCSGFVQQVYKHFGYSLPRTSDSQGSCGSSVSSSEMRPGDLVYYGGHIAIYIGGGEVVHASNERTGIKVSTLNYRSVRSIRNVIG